jgi:peptidoglycan/LPS O-acetylase OafA/YrhL
MFIITNQMIESNYRTLLSQGHFFIIGCLVHLTSPLYSKIFRWRKSWMELLLFVGAFIALFLFKTIENDVVPNLIKSALLFVLFTIALNSRLIKELLSIKLIYLLGGICYSIYLIHYPLLSFLSKIYQRYFSQNDFLVYCLLASTTVVFISVVFAILFERPFMNFDGFKSRIAAAIKK